MLLVVMRKILLDTENIQPQTSFADFPKQHFYQKGHKDEQVQREEGGCANGKELHGRGRICSVRQGSLDLYGHDDLPYGRILCH